MPMLAADAVYCIVQYTMQRRVV